MRRIVVIAAGPAGISAATRIKRRLPEHEINVIIPASIAELQAPPQTGPAWRRYAASLPNLEILASREVGVLEALDLMPDLEEHEITVTSARGRLPVRFTDLVMEVPATVRLPRLLQSADNVFGWPMPGFAAAPGPCDTALAACASSGKPVLVVGGGAPALDAVCLAREAGAVVHWLKTKEPETPAIEPQLRAIALSHLGDNVLFTDLPECPAEQLTFTLSGNEGSKQLTHITLPDGNVLAAGCCLWTTPLMGRHPVLREDGVTLDPFGRITLTEEASGGLNLFLMGSGSAVPGTILPGSGVELPAWTGGEETANYSAWLAVDSITGTLPGNRSQAGLRHGVWGVRTAAAQGLRFCRAGLDMAEAQNTGRDAEYAIFSLRPEHNEGDPSHSAASEPQKIILVLVCDKQSRSLLGAQVLGLGGCPSTADALFGMALAALADGTRVDALARRFSPGLPGRMLNAAAAVLCNKLSTTIKGITPDEFLASRSAGAEFFTLDLRSFPDWKSGHVPDAYNIPLPQLKKRLQDEVPRFTPIVLVSSDGRDAYAVGCRLAGLGATDLYVLDGGMQLWAYALQKGE